MREHSIYNIESQFKEKKMLMYLVPNCRKILPAPVKASVHPFPNATQQRWPLSWASCHLFLTFSVTVCAHIPEQCLSINSLVFGLSVSGIFYNLPLFNIMFLRFIHDSMCSCGLFSLLYHIPLHKYFIVYLVASHFHQYLVLSDFKIFADLVGVTW